MPETAKQQIVDLNHENGKKPIRHVKMNIVLSVALAVVATTLCRLPPAFAVASASELVPAPIFTEHMVLQREMPVPVWGRVDAGAEVTVTFAGQTKTAKADAAGQWKVKLDAMKASAEPRDMTIAVAGTDKKVTISDVLVGEVWLGSGQSNMRWAVAEGGYFAEASTAIAGKPPLRFFGQGTDEKANRSERGFGPSPVTVKELSWTPLNDATVHAYSATMVFFAVRLSEALDVPVGVIVRAVGSTSASKWMPGGVLSMDDPMVVADRAHYRALQEAAGKVPLRPSDLQQVPFAPEPFPSPELEVQQWKKPGMHYCRIAAIQPYALRGVCWDQGEHGTGFLGVTPATALNGLITSWRAAWQYSPEQMPFLVIQKPTGYGENRNDPHAIRTVVADAPKLDLPLWWQHQNNSEIQRRSAHAFIVNSLDLPGGLHPPRKDLYGARCAQVALARVYGRSAPYRTPMVKDCKIDGATAHLTFDDVGDGLSTWDGKPVRGFFLAGSDRVFFPATATIVATDRLDLTSRMVPDPVHVSSEVVRELGNLVSSDGLSACTFRSRPWLLPDPSAVAARVWPLLDAEPDVQEAAVFCLWLLGQRDVDVVARLIAQLKEVPVDQSDRARQLIWQLARYAAYNKDLEPVITLTLRDACQKRKHVQRFATQIAMDFKKKARVSDEFLKTVME